MTEEEEWAERAVGRMLGLALTVASWSSSPEGRQHGCVLAAEGRYVIATGYNGPPSGEGYCDCAGKLKDYCLENCRAVHAEVNAVCNAARIGARTLGSIAYVTKKPCEPCRGALINAGVAAIFWLTPERGGEAYDFESREEEADRGR